MQVSVCKKFHFCYAHLLPHHKGKCKNLHGHNGVLEVEVSLDEYNSNHSPEEDGMVIDFGKLKEIVTKSIINRFDHTNLNNTFRNPTAENLCDEFWSILQAHLPPYVELKRIRLYETDDSYAEITE